MGPWWFRRVLVSTFQIFILMGSLRIFIKAPRLFIFDISILRYGFLLLSRQVYPQRRVLLMKFSYRIFQCKLLELWGTLAYLFPFFSFSFTIQFLQLVRICLRKSKLQSREQLLWEFFVHLFIFELFNQFQHQLYPWPFLQCILVIQAF